MSVHQRKETGAWLVRYRFDGVKHSRTFGKGPEGKRLAEAFDLEIKMRKKLGEDLSSMISDDPYLGEIAQAYFDAKKVEGKFSKNMKSWVTNLNNNFLPTLGKIPVSRMSQRYIMSFILKNYGEHEVATRNRYLGYLRTIFNFAIDNGYIEKSPLEKWKPVKEEPRKSTLTVKQLAKIKKHAAPHLKWIIDVCYNLGLRTGVSELLVLRWSCIDWDNKSIRIYATKTKTWRVLPLNDHFFEQLKEYRKKAKTDYVIEYNGRPIKNFSRAFRRACERAGLDDSIIPYDIRHLFCTNLLQAGADIGSVSNMMGHSTVKQTVDTYYNPHEDEKIRSIGLLERI